MAHDAAPETIMDGQPFRWSDALASGLTDHRLRTLRTKGVVRQVLQGVYVDGSADDIQARIGAIRLVRPHDTVICRRTAAWLLGVDARGISPQEALPVECVVPSGRTPARRRGVRCYSAPLADDDVTVVGGVPCTTPTRTALDLLRYLRPHLGLAVADALAHAGLLSVDDLVARAEAWQRGRNIQQARRLAALCEPRSESFGESWLRLRILDAGFPPPEVQVPLGREFRLDLGYPDRRLGIEYDGLDFHSSPADRRHDAARRSRIRDEYGWTVLAVGRGEILGRSLDFERAMGELLGLEPTLLRRTW